MEKRVHIKGRLSALASYVDGSRITADIGCDHGRLSVALLQSGRAEYVYACDISADSLKKAEILRDKCGLQDKMSICLADGLSGLSLQPDTVIIAGMGGILISDIIKAGELTAKAAQRLVLQPMRGVAQLRKFLHNEGYHIDREMLCTEAGRIYQVISAHYVGTPQEFRILPDGFYEIGEQLITERDRLLHEYLKRLRNELSDAVKNAGSCGYVPEELKVRLSNTEKVIDLIKSN